MRKWQALVPGSCEIGGNRWITATGFTHAAEVTRILQAATWIKFHTFGNPGCIPPFGLVIRRDECPRSPRRHIRAPMRHKTKDPGTMNVHLDVDLLQPVIALVAGILILVIPRVLNYIVALYLILVGITGLWPHLLR